MHEQLTVALSVYYKGIASMNYIHRVLSPLTAILLKKHVFLFNRFCVFFTEQIS